MIASEIAKLTVDKEIVSAVPEPFAWSSFSTRARALAAFRVLPLYHARGHSAILCALSSAVLALRVILFDENDSRKQQHVDFARRLKNSDPAQGVLIYNTFSNSRIDAESMTVNSHELA